MIRRCLLFRTRLELALLLREPLILNLRTPSLPYLAKCIISILFLANIRSWPLAWHLRVFRPAFIFRLNQHLLRLRSLFSSRQERSKAEEEWVDSMSPVGADPMTYEVRYRTWTGMDDGDLLLHLSNSSYAKTLDAARMKATLAMFPRFFKLSGGWMPLSATHYYFQREIPMFARYEVRMRIGGWDNKWLYLIGKFVMKPKQGRKTPHNTTLSEPSSGTNSPSFSTPNLAFTTSLPSTSAFSLAQTHEEDGSIIHTITVSKVCFKLGRITVPPVLVLAINGFCLPTSSPTISPSISPPVSPSTAYPAQPMMNPNPRPIYSHINSPPHWPSAQQVFSPSHGGDERKLLSLLKGGWKEIPLEERWWEHAFNGRVDDVKAA